MPKNILHPFNLVTSAPLTANYLSEPVDVRFIDNVAFELVCTAGATGTFGIDGSLDFVPGGRSAGRAGMQSPLVAGTWVALTLSATPALTGSAANFLIQLALLPVGFVRVNYTYTSGSAGAVTITVAGKAV
jgi:hypothetical protein